MIRGTCLSVLRKSDPGAHVRVIFSAKRALLARFAQAVPGSHFVFIVFNGDLDRKIEGMVIAANGVNSLQKPR
jgi:hypothetical protein